VRQPRALTAAERQSVREVLYIYRGVARKYRPDFIIRLATGDLSQDSEFANILDAVNAHGGFGHWSWAVSRNSCDIKDILLQHSKAKAA
jgi:type III restriction enzyme